MIVALLGKSGAGKTTIARAMEKFVPNSVVIDGDDLRAETNNTDLRVAGRLLNMHTGYSRARGLADAGHTVFLAMQAPIKIVREMYLGTNDIQVLVVNNGHNPKDELGYNDNFDPDYSGVTRTVVLQEFSPEGFSNQHLKQRGD